MQADSSSISVSELTAQTIARARAAAACRASGEYWRETQSITPRIADAVAAAGVSPGPGAFLNKGESANLLAEPKPERPLVILTKSSSLVDLKKKKDALSKDNSSDYLSDNRKFQVDSDGVSVEVAWSKKKGEWLPVRQPDQVRSERFRLQTASGRLLPDYRVARCIRRRVSGADEVSIQKAVEHETAHYANLQICGSVWVCPVCAAKIAERRRQELRQVIDTHLAAGGGVMMVTLTFPHYQSDALSDLMSQLRDALVKLKSGKYWKAFREKWGWCGERTGSIRALEVTHGENGWHPHLHEIVLLQRPLSAVEIQLFESELYCFWKRASVRVGFPEPSRRFGVHVQPAESAADYVSKWGTEPSWEAARELTNANTKKGHAGGMTPFDLLRRYADGDAASGQLFKEFADAFFGFRQLFWSPGLKKAFGIVEKSDEGVAQEDDGPADEITRLTPLEWLRVLQAGYEARGVVLRFAETGGAAVVHEFVSTLPLIARPGKGFFRKRRKKVLPAEHF